MDASQAAFGCKLLLSAASLLLAIQLDAQIPLGGGAAGTALTSMWDQHKLEGLSRATKSAPAEKPPDGAAPSSISPWVPLRSPAPIKPLPTWTRQDASSFSAECPPAWIADTSTPDYLSFRPNVPSRKASSGDVWNDFEISLAYFAAPKNNEATQDDLRSVAQHFLEGWAEHDNLKLPEQLELSDVQTIFGPGVLAMFSYQTEFHYEEADRFLFVLRPRGVFLISASSPVTDSRVEQQVDHIFSSLSFQDKTQAEKVREFMRR